MRVIYRDQEWELEGSVTVRETIEKVGLSHRRMVALRDGRVIDLDTVLEEDDEVRLIAVISGGSQRHNRTCHTDGRSEEESQSLWTATDSRTGSCRAGEGLHQEI